MPQHIRLQAFDMACPGHIHQGLWRHPRDTSRRYTELAHWLDLARLLERGLFDGLFLADIIGANDVLGGSADAALRGGVQIPLLDPMLLIPAMATVTQHLGFAVTANIAAEPPYLLARRFSTLDHLTAGRIGWNIVTGYLESAARALGHPAQPAHDDRYAIAEDMLGALTALWEKSWEADAVRRDPTAGIYTDPTRVRAIRHAGPHLALDALHPCEPSPQRTPVLFQAGASDRGRAFAARHAEAVFLNGTSRETVAAQVRDLRARAAPRALRIFVGATLVVGRTAAEARDLFADYAASADTEAALAHAAASLGIDLARFGPDDPLPTATNAVQSNVTATAQATGPAWTKRRLTERLVLGGRQPPLVGSAADIADTLVQWADDTGADGFNLARTVMPECLENVIDLVVPILQERGRYKTEYTHGTYRQKLFAEQ